MIKSVQINAFGGPEVLNIVEVEGPKPGPDEVLIRHSVIGLDYIDTYHRSGLYPVPLPFTPGLEAAAVVEGLGKGVTGFSVGDRVAYPAGPPGSYCSHRVIPAAKLVKLPGDISDDDVAAMMLKACTVEYLIFRTFKVQKGQTVLFHAAAGGVGLIACQWLNALGVTVIGTVGSDEKAALARDNGCHHTINYRSEDFTARVMDITSGAGVPVVYDSVGRDTCAGSVACLQRRGTMVTFGNATGPVDPVPPGDLAKAGSIYLTRPTLMDYVATREDLELSTNRVFEAISKGHIRSNIRQRYALDDIQAAHRALEARQTTGQTVIMP